MPQNLAQTLTNQNNLQQQQNFQIQHQNMENLQNLHLQAQLQNQLQNLGNNIHLLNHPLNISIPDSTLSMQPQTVQSTEENQNIQVTENLTPQMYQQLLFLASQQNKTNNLNL